MNKSCKNYKQFIDEEDDNFYIISLSENIKANNEEEGNIQKVEEGPADFERAIGLAGYGKFNYMLLLAILPAAWASIYTSSAMSYILPSAECDLKLTMFDKGLLNSVTFAGMICSSFIWGFMTDTFGRKAILFYGYLVDAIINLASSFSQTAWMMILFKFLNGVIISGPFAALMSYLAEVHGEEHRSRMYMWLGTFFSLGNISVPCMAWLIIPHNWQWKLFNGWVVINSWRIFLALCSIPEFTACFTISLFPESPRFLLSKGRHLEALEVFKKIYTINTGKHPDTYPVKSLLDETPTETSGKNFVNALRLGWQQTKPLFQKPNIFRLFLITSIQFGTTLGSNSLRLWMPQLFAMIETYESTHPLQTHETYPSVCLMLNKEPYSNLSTLDNSTIADASVCTVIVLNATVYINSIIIAFTGVVGYMMAGALINAIGKKKLMVFCFISAGSCCGILYWAENSNGILGLSSVYVALSSIGGTAVISVIVDNFPTYLRTMAISVTLIVGRIGALTGNLLFPILLNVGCLGPFIMIGSACFCCVIFVLGLPPSISSLEKEKDKTLK